MRPRAPKPTHEPNGCDLEAQTPKTPENTLPLGLDERKIPQGMVDWTLPWFRFPKLALRARPSREGPSQAPHHSAQTTVRPRRLREASLAVAGPTFLFLLFPFRRIIAGLSIMGGTGTDLLASTVALLGQCSPSSPSGSCNPAQQTPIFPPLHP